MGIKLKAKIKVKHNYKNFETISSELAEKVSESLEDILKNIRGYAIKLEKGHNEQGILVEMVDVSNNEIKGRVYATPDKFMAENGSYLYFEYFGTGAFAEQEHIGNTKHFIESGNTEWLIPVKSLHGKVLPYPIVTSQYVPDVQFYLAHGVKANHFMTDAEFKTRNENIEIVKGKIEKMLEEVCK